MPKILRKLSQIQIEFTADEVEALKHILQKHTGDYEEFAIGLHALIS